MIVHDADKVDLFFSLSEEDKLEWVSLLPGVSFRSMLNGMNNIYKYV